MDFATPTHYLNPSVSNGMEAIGPDAKYFLCDIFADRPGLDPRRDAFWGRPLTAVDRYLPLLNSITAIIAITAIDPMPAITAIPAITNINVSTAT